MTKREKELLTKVLCEQLPYGVMCDRLGVAKKLLSVSPYKVYCLELDNGEYIPSEYRLEEIKPYLRPLSSMTEEEEAELSNILPCGMSFSYTTKEELIIYTDCEGDNDHYFICFVEVQDFLNAHHFDYRGLIPMGLAIAAVGENNPYKEKGGEKC